MTFLVAGTLSLAQQGEPVTASAQDTLQRLHEISRLQDPHEQKRLLEEHIQAHPNEPHLTRAYRLLWQALTRIDPKLALDSIDKVLAQSDSDLALKKTAYLRKFAAYREMKDEEAAAALGAHILESQSDPFLLSQAARFDLRHAVALYEKALQELETLPARSPERQTARVSRTSGMFVSNLQAELAEALSQEGRHVEAIEAMSKATAIVEKEIADHQVWEGADDWERAAANTQVVWLQRRLPELYRMMAEMQKRAGDVEQSLEYANRALQGTADTDPETLASLYRIRAELYESQGRVEEAFADYLQSFMAGMDAQSWEKIEAISTHTGRSLEEVRAVIQERRQARAEPFSPFELKTLEGKTKSLQDSLGQATLVNFFFPT